MTVRSPARIPHISQRAACCTYTWTHNICFPYHRTLIHAPVFTDVTDSQRAAENTVTDVSVFATTPNSPQPPLGIGHQYYSTWWSKRDGVRLTHLEREGVRGGPEEMFCPIRLMLMRPSASVRCNTFQSHILLASFLFVHTVMLRLYWAAEMTEKGRVVEVEWVYEWWERICLFVHHGMNMCLYVCECLWCFIDTHLCLWMWFDEE